MFNFLVSCNATAWEANQPMHAETVRFKEYSGNEAADITFRNPATLKLLEEVPALLTYELISDGPSIVRYGFLKNIRVTGSWLTFGFEPHSFCERDIVREFNPQLGINTDEYHRTHWAIKDGDIPRQLLAKMTPGPYRKFRFEVVLSFAGGDREYVDKVANILRQREVTTFYDLHHEADLWGKDLTEELDIIYSEEGRYCVMFVSKHYADKMWPTHERRSAFVRAVEQRSEYILPVRFDDTKVPGLRSTIGYIDGSRKSPEELGSLILLKLGKKA